METNFITSHRSKDRFEKEVDKLLVSGVGMPGRNISGIVRYTCINSHILD